jgi:diguanylate cyclase (GGDEF)-like protein
MLVIVGILLLNWLVMPLVHKLVRSERMARERLKESQCLHAIRRDMELNLQIDEFYPRVIGHLIVAMQFPEITSAMIQFDDKQFASDQYNKDFVHQLQAQILVNSKAYGCLHVAYSENQSFLLPEEQDLIDTIASDLGRWIELEQADQRIVQMATHDGLTGLPNRYLLQDRIKQALAHDRRRQEQAAVLFIDLDHFKIINDSLGHSMGDCLLQEVATRLRTTIRSEDTVVRHGGDEFIILLPSITDSQEAKVVAQKILNELIRSFHIQGKELHIGGSIGIALFPSDGDDMETLLKNSDIAMYQAKKSGRNNYQFFSSNML